MKKEHEILICRAALPAVCVKVSIQSEKEGIRAPCATSSWKPQECQQTAQLQPPHIISPVNAPQGSHRIHWCPVLLPIRGDFHPENHKFCFSSLFQSQILRIFRNCATEESRHVVTGKIIAPQDWVFLIPRRCDFPVKHTQPWTRLPAAVNIP